MIAGERTMRYRKKIDPLYKFICFAIAYLLIIGAVTSYLLPRIIDSTNPERYQHEDQSDLQGQYRTVWH